MGKTSAFFIKTAVSLISRGKLSVLGGIMTSVLAPVLLICVVLDIRGTVDNPYFGFLIYLILGPLFVLGLILLIIGVFISRGKEDIGLFTFEYIEEQLTRPGRYTRIRRHILLSLIFTLSTLLLVTLVSYTGFHYTESTAFCGLTCHQVMGPAYATYQHSPHSRISCVECHIGKQSQWLTKAKFSGAKQIFAVLFDTYPRPIPQPITSLRPIRETCEECHRPEMFHGDKLYIKDRFLPDEHNTHVQTALLMKIGSGGYLGRKAQGIHWHVSEDHPVFYKYTDHAQEDVAEVWLQDGEREIRFSKASATEKLDTSQQGTIRKMDCMDCHNRPTHVFLSADEALDEKLVTGIIPREIPFIKRQALETITPHYASIDEALQKISRGLKEWYDANYPDLANQDKTLLDKAIAGVQQAYMENVFPEMNIDWDTYTDFIGHKNGSGCFRCHDGRHVSENGQTISNDCDSCHFILAENQPSPDVLSLLQQTFQHQRQP
ncbi:MAG: NapC/NirT family cytochrome c [Proteobacteria bacterium]|nr:NapC/NirT family cytochrome c [Pseudomonadota bacterium]MBU4294477.1 NapC/NirT family cytochrome c [Pseudomonadota bacterium]MCG2749184.1 NapC/NirT family cytochrome c [Desulfobulbaceae bacterium]